MVLFDVADKLVAGILNNSNDFLEQQIVRNANNIFNTTTKKKDKKQQQIVFIYKTYRLCLLNVVISVFNCLSGTNVYLRENLS